MVLKSAASLHFGQPIRIAYPMIFGIPFGLGDDLIREALLKRSYGVHGSGCSGGIGRTFVLLTLGWKRSV